MKTICIIIFLSLVSFSSQSQLPAFTSTLYNSSSTGYYFMSDQLYMMILDRAGSAVWYESGMRGFNFALQQNGLMTFSNNGKFYFMDSTFTVVDSIWCKNVYQTDAHELRFLSNGNFLLLGIDTSRMDLSNFFWNGSFGNANAIVRSAVIQEQDANRNVVFEWHAKDYFSFDDIDTFFMNSLGSIDWTHANAIEEDVDGNFLLSIRHFDEITKINRADSSIMWRLGGKRNEFTYVDSPLPFYGQHDIRRISNGHVTLFDDGENYTSHGARALEFELDEQNKIATQKWSYVYDSMMYSGAQGSVHRLANSNTVVNYGFPTGGNVCFVVVDTAGQKIMEVDGINSYRVLNYPTLPWQLHRPQINCFDSLGTFYLDAGAGYTSYSWSNGDSTQIIPVTSTDTYFVFVPYGQLGFISSEKFIVIDTSNVCGTILSSPEIISDDFGIKIFPNPASSIVTISFSLNNKSDVHISISDILGREVVALENKTETSGKHFYSYELSQLVSGIYFIHINNVVKRFIKL